MLKSLIWGSDAPMWEEAEEDDEEGEPSQDVHRSAPDEPRASQPDSNSNLGEPPAIPSNTYHHRQTVSKLRAKYTLKRGGPRAGPLSLNDPELAIPQNNFKPQLSEGFFVLPPPRGPAGVGSDWRIDFRDAVVHVHRLLRRMMVGHDYAGAARTLAVLHRLHGAFDPDVYRYTVALLRLSGDHTKTMMYMRKVMGVMLRTPSRKQSFRGSAIAHDCLAYLADTQEYKEALSVCQNIQFIEGKGGRVVDPMLRAHVAVLHLFAALLEHQHSSSRGTQRKTKSHQISTSSLPSVALLSRIPDLQDSLSLVGPLRACWKECSNSHGDSKAGGPGGDILMADQSENDGDDDWRARALGHLNEAKKLAREAVEGSPGNASAAGYYAAIAAAERGAVAGMRQLDVFVERNPGSVKGRALHARLWETMLRDANARSAIKQEATAGIINQSDVESGATGRGEGGGGVEGVERGGTHLIEVARARSLRGWLETDPLEPRAALGLASLHARRISSGAIFGVANEAFIVKSLVLQVETHGHPRMCCPCSPQPASVTVSTTTASTAVSLNGSANDSSDRSASPRAQGVPYNTTRAAMALWQALADVLGSLRVRDAPVPLVPSLGAGGEVRRSAAAAPPRPGTIWDHLYGRDPPWTATDFQRCSGDNGVGFREGGGRGSAVVGVSEGLSEAPIPHPLLRNVDKELWEDAMLDASADPLLLEAAVAGQPGNAGEEETEIWCSDDEDCVVNSNHDGESANNNMRADEEIAFLLQERSRLSSRRDGGCVYYVPPPAAEEEIRSWARDDGDEQRDVLVDAAAAGGVCGATTVGSSAAAAEERGGRGKDVLGIERETMKAEQRDDMRYREGVGKVTAMLPTGDGRGDELSMKAEGLDVNSQNQEGSGLGEHDFEGRKRMGSQPRQEEAVKWTGGDVIGKEGSVVKGEELEARQEVRGDNDGFEASGRGEAEAQDARKEEPKPKRRRLIVADEEEDEEDADGVVHSPAVQAAIDWTECVNAGNSDVDNGGRGTMRDDILRGDLRDDADGGPEGLREAEVPLGPPVGADAEAARLSEVVPVKMPAEEAVWLLTNKCCVAAHIFGPQHAYCLRAIGRLCRNDVREVARSARETLRRRGFRLQLSLARLAAENARAAAALEGHRGVGWGLSPIPGRGGHVQPRDSYIPEFTRPYDDYLSVR